MSIAVQPRRRSRYYNKSINNTRYLCTLVICGITRFSCSAFSGPVRGCGRPADRTRLEDRLARAERDRTQVVVSRQKRHVDVTGRADRPQGSITDRLFVRTGKNRVEVILKRNPGGRIPRADAYDPDLKCPNIVLKSIRKRTQLTHAKPQRGGGGL